MNPLDRTILIAVVWVALGYAAWAIWHPPQPMIAGVFPYVSLSGDHVLVVTGEHFSFGLTPRVVPHGRLLELHDRMREATPILLDCAYFSPTFLEVHLPASLPPGDYDLGLFQDALKLAERPHVPVW